MYLNFHKKSKFLLYILVVVLIVVSFCFIKVSPVLAQVQKQDLLSNQFVKNTNLATTDIRVLIARIIRGFLGLLGVIALSLIVYAGFLWMTSGGDTNKIDNAKKILINAVIGLLIILSSFAITEFVFRVLLGIGSQKGGGISVTSGGQAAGGLFTFRGGALGKVIKSHYPDRDAVDVPRNTRIIITFVEEINPDTIFDKNTKLLNLDSIKLYTKSNAGADGSPPSDKNKLVKDIEVSTIDNKTFVLRPKTYLGSPSENVTYFVYLSSRIQNQKGKSIFSGLNGSYSWSFTTGTTLDLVPPKVESVLPVNPKNCTSKCVPPNSLILVNFNEAIDPTTVAGIFPNAAIKIELTPQVKGEFVLTNKYRSLVFTPSLKCDGVDKNSCGDDVFCLKKNQKYSILLKAAILEAVGSPQGKIGTGITDLAGNSLDGNSNGKAEGPSKDNYSWSFDTSDKVDLVPPKIEEVTPKVRQSNVPLNQKIKIKFTKNILPTTLFRNVKLLYKKRSEQQLQEWGGAVSTYFGNDTKIKNKVDPSLVVLDTYYNLFPARIDKSGKTEYYDYYPEITSGVKDLSQNCFKPAVGPLNDKFKCVEQSTGVWRKNVVNTAPWPNCELIK